MLISILTVLMLTLVGSGGYLYAESTRRQRLQARIAFASGHTTRNGASSRTFLDAAGKLGSFISAQQFLSKNNIEALKKALVLAGINDPNAIYILMGAKLFAALGFLALALIVSVLWSLPSRTMVFICLAAFLAGMMLPDYAIRYRRKIYLKRLENGIPDMLDMMVICSEAGLNLEATIERVQKEIGLSHPEVGRELRQTSHDLRIGADRRTALLNLGTRTELSSLKRLTMTLVQAVQYGTPLGEALRSLAGELRTEMLTRYEANAGKLPAILTIPMILFILPTVVMIILGPAVLSLRHMFSGTFH